VSFGLNLVLFFLTIKILKANFANIFLLALLSLLLVGTTYLILLNYFSFPFPILTHIIDSLPSLVGSLTYLYVYYSINSFKKIHAISLIHFLPFFIAFPLSFISTDEVSIISVFYNIGLKIIVGIIYFIWSLRILNVHKRLIKNNFSKIDKIDLKWLAFVVWIALISYLIYLSVMILWVLNIQIVANVTIYANAIVFLFILSISYYSLSSTTVFKQISNFKTLNSEIPDENITNALINDNKKELMSLESAEQIFRTIVLVIETKKMYKIENLMLEDLSKELNIHSKYLSSVINRVSNKNFFDFINSFRIKEFNTEVLNPKNRQLTYLAIAFDCGFGSKSAFNRAYKNEMGVSPSVFVKNQKAE
jgi:AraC-like DNA-binding protein